MLIYHNGYKYMLFCLFYTLSGAKVVLFYEICKYFINFEL